MGTSLEEALDRVRARRNLPDPRTRRAIRLAAGIPQRVVAAELRVSRVQVSRIENGRREPGPEVAVRYAALLDRLRQEIA